MAARMTGNTIPTWKLRRSLRLRLLLRGVFAVPRREKGKGGQYRKSPTFQQKIKVDWKGLYLHVNHLLNNKVALLQFRCHFCPSSMILPLRCLVSSQCNLSHLYICLLGLRVALRERHAISLNAEFSKTRSYEPADIEWFFWTLSVPESHFPSVKMHTVNRLSPRLNVPCLSVCLIVCMFVLRDCYRSIRMLVSKQPEDQQL